MCRTVVVSLL
nr:unnamed protein product [Callosobruchus analis]